MFTSLDISTSALVAQRTRLNAISQNLANQYTTHDAQGNYAPYRRRITVFAPGDPSTGSEQGVHVREILEDPGDFRKVYEGPDHPLADKDGYVHYPNVHPAYEMVNALEASRAYEANITAVEATKAMANAALQLLA